VELTADGKKRTTVLYKFTLYFEDFYGKASTQGDHHATHGGTRASTCADVVAKRAHDGCCRVSLLHGYYTVDST
jgi:hypothetical protein